MVLDIDATSRTATFLITIGLDMFITAADALLRLKYHRLKCDLQGNTEHDGATYLIPYHATNAHNMCIWHISTVELFSIYTTWHPFLDYLE